MSKKSVNPKFAATLSKHGKATLSDAKSGTQGKHGLGALVSGKPALLESKWLPLILMSFLLVFASLLYFPVAFQGKTPRTHDITEWQGASNKIIEYNKTHSDRALWTQSMFSGMPSYMISFPTRWPFLENITKATDKVINWRIFLWFIGALGMFLLLRVLKMDPWVSFFGAVAFMFSCHWLGLLEIGHNTKFRAIMYIPWVVSALLYLRQKPGLLGLGMLATTLIMQLRENHPQISYYLYLFMGMYWLWQLIESVRSRKLGKFGLFTLLLVVAFGLTVLAVLNPYLSTMEYSHFTSRGGAAGLDKAYAQGWSFHPKEIITFFIPDFYGGVSPNYWGYMSFTQIYNYFGLAVLALGVIAILGRKHRRLGVFLGGSSLVFLLMSFGSATPWLSDLFFKYLPYFNKFRVPSMILTMVQFNAAILAALGIDTLLEAMRSKDAILQQKWSKGLRTALYVCGGALLLWLIAAKGLFGGMSFTSAGEAEQLKQYGMATLPGDTVATRLGLLYQSGIQSLLFLTLTIGLAYLGSLKKLGKVALVFLLTLVTFIDLYIYTGRNFRADNLMSKEENFNRFNTTDYDKYILANNQDNHRIFPANLNFFANRPDLDPQTAPQIANPQLGRSASSWAFHHQTVNGYSAAKLKRYDDFLRYLLNSQRGTPWEWDNYLSGFYGSSGEFERPTPLLDMLSVRYIPSPDSLPYQELLTQIVPVFTSMDEPVTIYENTRALPRAWFVEGVQRVAPADSILPLLIKNDFDPRRVAYVESELKGVSRPDSSFVKQTVAEMHKLAYDVFTDQPAFLVLSEIYYPAGWKANLDDKPVEIHPANYILRGIQIPAGKHKLELVFAPESYKKSVSLSFIGLLLSLLALGGGLLWQFLARRKQAAGPQD